ncbi:NAD(P)/FAD-dependent oxidoreductase [Rhodopseudomonas boonkerdii]|uniref:NAD(P)/FAD-dependent oxidoreductase n=1 Tax=Rhodopseudomonas boonkerdii TaxID=475937 RepID=UPI001E51F9AE|nr:NAD(P)/FAD-dependent oxidoreductase [Rhodopseudomonas boonkerdii]UGV27678.1 NAD(P)/FAD-dependent oxidoreductase [Rhodopseudomonas boonkerdii]
MTASAIKRIVVVGAGFGGLEAVRNLAETMIPIVVIDQRNHHLFQPLLYQVATASLGTSEIAWPIRSLLSRYKNVTTLLGHVTGVDLVERKVRLEDGGSIDYDVLILATGARHSYFGHDEWEKFAPGLKTLEDATYIRRKILTAFEAAERARDEKERAKWLTFVVIGAGPTGVELAGTIAELAKETLKDDFRNYDTQKAVVILIEAGARILPGFVEELSAYAQRALEALGVEIRLGHAVTDCRNGGVETDGELLPAGTIIWAAGVAASPAAEWLGVTSDRAGRVMVEPDLSVPGHPEVFVIGDTAHVETRDGKLLPGIAPVAKQEGCYVAKLVSARLAGGTIGAFSYSNVGSLATIGKRAAVIDFGWTRLKGRLAWWIWGVAHIYFLIGLKHRLAVALSWLWIHSTGQRSARLITQGEAKDGTILR